MLRTGMYTEYGNVCWVRACVLLVRYSCVLMFYIHTKDEIYDPVAGSLWGRLNMAAFEPKTTVVLAYARVGGG